MRKNAIEIALEALNKWRLVTIDESFAAIDALKDALKQQVESEIQHGEPVIGVDPDAWATTNMCVGPKYGETQYGKLPIQSTQPGYYSHEKLYSEKSVRGLMKAAYYNGHASATTIPEEGEPEIRWVYRLYGKTHIAGTPTVEDALEYLSAAPEYKGDDK